MSKPVYIRLDKEQLDSINLVSKDEKLTRSEAIKRLVNYALSKVRIEKALMGYKDGKYTIREASEIAGMRYFEFFDVMAKENLIGTSPESIERLLIQIKNIR